MRHPRRRPRPVPGQPAVPWARPAPAPRRHGGSRRSVPHDVERGAVRVVWPDGRSVPPQDESVADALLVRDITDRTGIRALEPFADYLLGVSFTAAARVPDATEPLQRAADGFSVAPNRGWWMTGRGT